MVAVCTASRAAGQAVRTLTDASRRRGTRARGRATSGTLAWGPRTWASRPRYFRCRTWIRCPRGGWERDVALHVLLREEPERVSEDGAPTRRSQTEPSLRVGRLTPTHLGALRSMMISDVGVEAALLPSSNVDPVHARCERDVALTYSYVKSLSASPRMGARRGASGPSLAESGDSPRAPRLCRSQGESEASMMVSWGRTHARTASRTFVVERARVLTGARAVATP